MREHGPACVPQPLDLGPTGCYNTAFMPTTPAFPSPEAEAARYALMRRLAPSMRHHLVVNLQPIGMIYEVMERRLRAAAPDLAHVQDSAGKINGFAKAALQSCVDVVGWISPDDAATCTVPAAIHECTGLLATSLGFRGFALRNEAGELPGLVRRAAIRNLLSATLLHCTDDHQASADLVLHSAHEDQCALVTVAVRPTPAGQGISSDANYRAIGWNDLQALALADGAQLGREDGRILLRFPWMPAPP
jgi:hypothetical protein